MAEQLAARTPVIIAIGEVIDRPEDPAKALEPVALMAKAMQHAEKDTPGVLAALDSIDLVGQITWRYRNPVMLLCNQLSIKPNRAENASMGGETPIRLIHEAALRISRGESTVSAIVGGEAVNAMGKARKAQVKLGWTPLAPKEETVEVDFASLPIRKASKRLGMAAPVHIYPLYENAFQAMRGQNPAEGRAEAAALWADYARIAAGNEYAWLRSAPKADEIGTPSQSNRLVAFPYPKLMVANPSVNQSAAVVVASLEWARANGVSEENLIYIWDGAAAQEPGDYLDRDGYDHSTAQRAVLERAIEIVGGDASAIDLAEMYSCFPIVPKMALETLKLRPDVKPTVTGGLTFFGGPMNNYMSHGVCAMVRQMRAGKGSFGLLYGQGGVVSKHHAILVSTQVPSKMLNADYSVQAQAEALRGPVPEFADSYEGMGRIETYTIIYTPKGEVLHGVVLAITADGRRTIAKVRRDHANSIALLSSLGANPIGKIGHIRTDAFGAQIWEEGERKDRRAHERRFCLVERDGPVTLVTINRPDAMNALTPYANEELCEVFDEFQSDPDQWVAILTGAGDKAFSSGNDLKFTAQAMAAGLPLETPLKGFAGLTARWDNNKPIIAAVNGIAMGGGFEIALACDLIIASDTAIFALPEPKVGLAALAGGLHRLPRQIGLKHAMGMILTARRVSANEGLALGFVNEVVPYDMLLAAARRWAEEISACSPMSIRASKEVVMKGLDEIDLKTAYAHQTRYEAVGSLFRSDDVREGPLAFSQKRAPVWKGR